MILWVGGKSVGSWGTLTFFYISVLLKFYNNFIIIIIIEVKFMEHKINH